MDKDDDMEIITHLEEENTRLRRQLVFLHSLYEFAKQLIGKTDLNEISWMVTKKLISQFELEDCVIYTVKNGICHQVAAYGPKNIKGRAIYHPITIKVGEGIVGHVASTGIPEMIADTTIEPRYIIDDVKRHSELTVPIFHGNSVVGVIDSEHSDPGFYTNDHLNMFMIIASLISHLISNALNKEAQGVKPTDCIEKANYLNAILDSSMDAIITTCERGVITDWNQEATNIFGFTYEEATSEQLMDFVQNQLDEVELEKDLGGNEGIGSEPSYNFKGSFLHKNGNRVKVKFSKRKFKFNNQTYFTFFFRAID